MTTRITSIDEEIHNLKEEKTLIQNQLREMKTFEASLSSLSPELQDSLFNKSKGRPRGSKNQVREIKETNEISTSKSLLIQVLEVLFHHPSLQANEIVKALPHLTSQQIYPTINNAWKHKWIKRTGTKMKYIYSLTKAGKIKLGS